MAIAYGDRIADREDMGVTKRIIEDRESRPDDLVAAGEIIELRYRDGAPGLGLRSAKLFHMLIKAAGAKATDDVEHRVQIEQLNFFHADRDLFVECIRDLVGTVVELQIRDERQLAVTLVDPLIHSVERPTERVIEGAGDELAFRFSKSVRRILASSDVFAILNRQAVLAFQSRFSLRLYEMLMLRKNLSRVTSEVFELADLRRRMGVGPKSFKLWADFRRFVLDRAIQEINQLAPFIVTYEAGKRGRRVATVKITWTVKDHDDGQLELDRSSVGRKARREGTVETIVEAPARLTVVQTGFPEDGSIAYGKWGEVARQCCPPPVPDVDLVAAAFRRSVREKGQKLDATGVEEHFRNFCRRWRS